MSSTPNTFTISFLLLLALPPSQAFVLPQLNILSSPLLAATTADGVVKNAGDSALSSVEWFGSLVSKSDNPQPTSIGETVTEKGNIDGTGGSVYNRLASTIDADENKETQVWAALANLEKDSKSKGEGCRWCSLTNMECCSRVALVFLTLFLHVFAVSDYYSSVISRFGSGPETSTFCFGSNLVECGCPFRSIRAVALGWQNHRVSGA